MNVFVADPGWSWEIVLYFFVGGIAAGAYFMATLIELVGSESDRPLARLGYWIAFPLICICGLLLVVDLKQPGRFWHMLLKSEIVRRALAEGWPWSGSGWRLMSQAPLLKFLSPMSIGSWALALFGLCSLASLVGSLRPGGRLARLLHTGFVGRTLAVIGSAVGFFVAAYTGSLLTATNQPIWSDSTWIAALFLTSAASTGIAAMILLAHGRGLVSAEPLDRLERADLWVLGLEFIVFGVFLASLGALLLPVVRTWHGIILVVGTLLLGLLLPLAIHLRVGIAGRRSAVVASALVLLGGFVLRYGLLTTPPEILKRGPEVVVGMGSEDGRPRGSPGADPGNKASEWQPRSKVFTGD